MKEKEIFYNYILNFDFFCEYECYLLHSEEI